MEKLILYSYFRSSAAYRVRIALNLKELNYELRPVHLLRDGGMHRRAEYRDINPQGLVPALQIQEALDDGIRTMNFNQSLAILEYLEERYPEPPLLPKSPETRAFVRSLALMICCDIHPLNNLRVLNYLKQECELSEARAGSWYRHWIEEGFAALEKTLARTACPGTFCYGDRPSLADVCLVPQVYNALRFDCDLQPFPRISGIYQHCLQWPAFAAAAPECQTDAE